MGVLHHARHGEEGQALRVLHHAVRFAPLAARSGRPSGWFAGAVHHDSAHRPLRVLHHAVQPVPMTWPSRRWPSGGSSSSPGELLQQLARWTAAVGGSSSSRRRPRRRAWKKRPRQSAYNARKQPRDGRGLGLCVKIAPGASQAAMQPFPSALARPPACKTRFLAIQAARSYQVQRAHAPGKPLDDLSARGGPGLSAPEGSRRGAPKRAADLSAGPLRRTVAPIW